MLEITMQSKITLGGFTLIELMVALAIATILMTVGIPSFIDQMDTNRLTAATERIYSDLKMARSESLRSNKNVWVNVQKGDNWCYGLTEGAAACDCQVTNSEASNYCHLSRKTASNFPQITIPDQGVTFVNNITGFDPVRGIPFNSGSITLRSQRGKSSKIILAALGKVSFCSPSGTGEVYKTC